MAKLVQIFLNTTVLLNPKVWQLKLRNYVGDRQLLS